MSNTITNGSNRVTHRTIGSIPHCIPAPHDKSLLEELGICEESTGDVYCKTVDLFMAGKINWGTLTQTYWSQMNRRGMFGDAIRREIVNRHDALLTALRM